MPPLIPLESVHTKGPEVAAVAAEPAIPDAPGVSAVSLERNTEMQGGNRERCHPMENCEEGRQASTTLSTAVLPSQTPSRDKKQSMAPSGNSSRETDEVDACLSVPTSASKKETNRKRKLQDLRRGFLEDYRKFKRMTTDETHLDTLYPRICPQFWEQHVASLPADPFEKDKELCIHRLMRYIPDCAVAHSMSQHISSMTKVRPTYSGMGEGLFALKAHKAGDIMWSIPIFPDPAINGYTMDMRTENMHEDDINKWKRVNLGKISEKINHSCDRNATWLDAVCNRGHMHVVLVCVKNISRNQEIFVDYGDDYFLDEDDGKLLLCQCKSKGCRFSSLAQIEEKRKRAKNERETSSGTDPLSLLHAHRQRDQQKLLQTKPKKLPKSAKSAKPTKQTKPAKPAKPTTPAKQTRRTGPSGKSSQTTKQAHSTRHTRRANSVVHTEPVMVKRRKPPSEE